MRSANRLSRHAATTGASFCATGRTGSLRSLLPSWTAPMADRRPRAAHCAQSPGTDVTRDAREDPSVDGFAPLRFGRRVVSGVFDDFAKRYAAPGAGAPAFRPSWKQRSVLIKEARLAWRDNGRTRCCACKDCLRFACASTARYPKEPKSSGPCGLCAASVAAEAKLRPGTRSGSASTFQSGRTRHGRTACAAGTRCGPSPAFTSAGRDEVSCGSPVHSLSCRPVQASKRTSRCSCRWSSILHRNSSRRAR